jgi:pimeloyl-[acyl-carrier protein] synthase
MFLPLEHPDNLSRLRADPDLVGVAIEEMLRLVTPVTAVICEARERTEIAGYVFPEGRRRFAFLAAANRDPDVFDNPDEFLIGRAAPRHLAFSAGGHFCLGAPLARLHAEIGIGMLLKELPELHLAGTPTWRGSIPLRELEHLPVAWDTTERRGAGGTGSHDAKASVR